MQLLLTFTSTIANMKIEEVAQKQIDEIMDTFRFSMVVEGLKANPACWLNKLEESERESALRKRSRELMRSVVETTIAKYRNSDRAHNETNVETGCMKATCVVANYDDPFPWIRVDLLAVLEATLMDGEQFVK